MKKNPTDLKSRGSKKQYILLVEHDAGRMLILQDILFSAGYRNLICAESQEQAFKSIRPFQGRVNDIGAIFLNYDLPQTDTLKLSEVLTTLDGHEAIPLIFLTTGQTELSDKLVERCYAANAETIIHHPSDGDSLTSLVHFALALKSERDDRISNDEALICELSERRIMDTRLKYLVAHDELTGLSNRSGLEKVLGSGILRCKNFKQSSALFDLDLDQFKVINDIEGHEAGDRLLIEVATLIRSRLDEHAFIARVGSNEFQVFLGKATKKYALETAENLRCSIDGFDFQVDGNIYHISASIGVALMEPLGGIERPSELMSLAHQACYKAKNLGRNRVCLFERDDDELQSLRDDAKWVPLIRKALSNDAFKLFFQPVVRVKDGKVSHYETLLRLVGDDGELLSPAHFIPVAERMGLIRHVDLWVVSHLIDYISNLPHEQKGMSFTVNLSSCALQSDYLLPMLKAKLEETWVSPSRLTFEITETAAVTDFDKTRLMVTRIRALGCHFALDDFGAGFSSFNYIKNFPVDYLKIDGQFIVNLVTSQEDQILVKAMIDMARSLGKKTIAEYVSNAEILRVLEEFEVDYIQGYLLGKPGENLLDERYLLLDELMEKQLDIEELIAL